MARPFKKPEPKERRSKDQQLEEILLEISTKPEPNKMSHVFA